MLASILTGLAGNVVMGWVWRRVLEVAGWLGVAASIYAGLPPEYQGVVLAILTGQGGTLTIGAGIGFAVYVWSQVMSYRATTKPQVVTGSKTKLDIPVLTDEQAKDMVERETGVRPETIPTRRR